MKQLVHWKADGMPLQYAEVLSPKEERKEAIKLFVDGAVLLLFFYMTVGLSSLIAVAMGEKVSYMPFWHAPWRWIILHLAK